MRTRRTLASGATALLATLALLSGSPAAQAATRAPSPPPARAAVAAATADTAAPTGPVCWYGSCYDYVSGRQITDTAGASVRMLQADPEIKPGDVDSHSLQELALQSTDHLSTVEIGWTVDFGLNGDTKPHLFVYHWVNGAESCYNACGFVQVSRTVKPGMAVRPGTEAKFTIQNLAGDWWVFYDDHAVGYFPGSLWSGSYTRAQVVTAFGEVAHATGSTCEDMGNGRPGSSGRSGLIEDFQLHGSKDRPALTVTATSPALYSAGHVTRTSFHLGGAGSGPC
ncbi:neprosin family prolyl endopeptidase [Kitasatospora mediocidica]|uniref:neprosin family prolyl endopeptidase n=1 Tax=Kitasatospora mediocidica TaxID=58352 RepID=UPI000562194C|nr:neprosin family prolyl endopeptidase [Kitasatospora mediocidica]